MKNIEKYEKEIIQYNGRFAVTKEGQVVNCSGLDCRDCLFLKGCTKLKMQWLMKEYEEPILTDEEKKILNDLIEVNKKLSNSKLLHVTKICAVNNYSKCYLKFNFEKCNICDTVLFYSDSIFKRMETNKQYSLEDLGLC